MPYVSAQITEGASREQKQRVVERINAAIVQELDKEPEHIHIVIQEIPLDSWGFAGMLTDDYRDRAKGE